MLGTGSDRVRCSHAYGKQYVMLYVHTYHYESNIPQRELQALTHPNINLFLHDNPFNHSGISDIQMMILHVDAMAHIRQCYALAESFVPIPSVPLLAPVC
eukprot:5275736-Pyramimonas_sp.AAC.1